MQTFYRLFPVLYRFANTKTLCYVFGDIFASLDLNVE
jgi:hypothetical protein